MCCTSLALQDLSRDSVQQDICSFSPAALKCHRRVLVQLPCQLAGLDCVKRTKKPIRGWVIDIVRLRGFKKWFSSKDLKGQWVLPDRLALKKIAAPDSCVRRLFSVWIEHFWWFSPSFWWICALKWNMAVEQLLISNHVCKMWGQSWGSAASGLENPWMHHEHPGFVSWIRTELFSRVNAASIILLPVWWRGHWPKKIPSPFPWFILATETRLFHQHAHKTCSRLLAC